MKSAFARCCTNSLSPCRAAARHCLHEVGQCKHGQCPSKSTLGISPEESARKVVRSAISMSHRRSSMRLLKRRNYALMITMYGDFL
ncbi:hypothetical protein GUJ93_ZPchr0007g5954 [Zizania palustris]|uniref:Uncharacterized protein n=1 Tax=Zizania palustris TaxID=103762 RepID=A0A8J5W4P5_ZIZPA|nr:hypothetical protein GUJ93_ZPchr0007g5954 [Zizania palustris]